MANDITVILNGYNRGYIMQKQIDAIKTQSVKNTIMLWYNKGEEEQYKVEDETIKTAYSNYNFKFHARFAFALLAKTKYVAFFDDDIIPGPKWLEHCLEYAENGILGASGVYLHGNDYETGQKYGYTGTRPTELTEVDLVGHSWFLKRDWLQYQWREYPISWENGEDIQLSYLCKKYGNIKTYVPPMSDDPDKHPNIEMKWSTDKYSSFFKANHSLVRDQIVRVAIEKGWKTVKMTKEENGSN